MAFLIQRKSLIKNLVSIISIDVLIKASGILLLPIYLKLMTQEEFGLYSYGIGLSAFLASLGAMGLYGAINRYFYDKNYSKEEVVSTLLILLIVSIILFMIFFSITISIWSSAVFSGNVDSTIIILVVFSALHGVLIQFIMGFFYINKSYKEIQIFNLTRLGVVNSVALGIMYFFSQNAVTERLSGLILSELLVCILFLRYLSKYFSFENFNKKLAKQSLIFGYPLALNAILGFIYSFADKYFIQSNFDFTSLGEYVFIFTFASMFGILFSAIQNFWLPYFFNPDNKHFVLQKLIQLVLVLFILVIIYYFAILFLLKFLFYLNIFDVAYEVGVSYLWLLVFAQFFSSVSSLLNNYYSLYNKNLYGLYISLVMSIVSIVIMYCLINAYQVYGTALAVMINSIISLMLTFVFVRYLKMKYHE